MASQHPISNGTKNGESHEKLSALDELSSRASRFFGHDEHPDAPKPAEASHREKYDQIWTKMSASVTQLGTLLAAVRAPLPTDTGNGSVLPPQEPKASTKKLLTHIVRDLAYLGPELTKNLVTVAQSGLTHSDLDDRKFYMERLVQAASLLPPDEIDTKLTTNFVTQLWNDLQHPPQTLLSDEYRYRQPDGSSNNFMMPHIGKAGMAYARTVAPMHKQSACLPDPGTLFDSVMARKKPEGTEHPAKVSSFLFYLASIIIHDIFKTDHFDYNISGTSSYLDLAPLYGSDWKEQKRMRTMKDGKIKVSCYDSRGRYQNL